MIINMLINIIKEVMKREPYDYPNLIINRKVDSIEDFKISDFKLDDYKYHDAIKVQVAV